MTLDTAPTSAPAAPAAAAPSSTPASAAPAAAAPARSGVSSGTATEAMIKAAMASEAGATTTPSEPPAAASAAAPGAIAQPGAPESSLTTEPPKERWDSILANQRRLAAEEALKPYEWAKGIKADQAQAAIELLGLLRKDKKAFWKELGETIEPDVPTEFTFPEPDYTNSDGATFHSSGSLKKILDLFKSQLMTQLHGELRPLMEFRDGELTSRERAARVNNARSLSARALTSARALPHFKEHEAAIVEKLSTMDPAIRKEMGPVAAMYMAFEAVKAEKVYPTLQADAEKRVRAEFDRKAAASGVSPVGGDGKVGEVPVIKGEQGLAAHLRKLAESNDPRFAAR